DGRTLASGAEAPRKNAPGEVRLWDIITGKERHAWPAHTGDVQAIAFAPNAPQLITGGADGAFKVWDLATRQLLVTRTQRAGRQALAFVPDGRYLIAGYVGSGLLVCDTSDWLEQVRLIGHRG